MRECRWSIWVYVSSRVRRRRRNLCPNWFTARWNCSNCGVFRRCSSAVDTPDIFHYHEELKIELLYWIIGMRYSECRWPKNVCSREANLKSWINLEKVYYFPMKICYDEQSFFVTMDIFMILQVSPEINISMYVFIDTNPYVMSESQLYGISNSQLCGISTVTSICLFQNGLDFKIRFITLLSVIENIFF
jgi:hypothetical protein